MTALVRSQRQQHNPLALIAQERLDGVFAHVGSNGQRIGLCLTLKETAGIHGRGVSNVTTLGVGNDKVVGVVLVQVLYQQLVSLKTSRAISLEEGEVGFESHTVRSRQVGNVCRKRHECAANIRLFVRSHLPHFVL